MKSKSLYAWTVVALLLVVWMLNYLDRQVISSVFPLLKADLKVTDIQLGLLTTAFLWVYSLCSPIAGHLADRFGKKLMICGSLVVWSTLTIFTGRAHSFHELIAFRSLMGVSEACYLPAGLALIAAYHGTTTRSRAVSLHYSGTYLGTVLGGTLGGWIGQTYGWRSVFGVFGLIGVIYGTILLFVLREKTDANTMVDWTPKDTMKLKDAAAVIFRTPGYKTLLAVFSMASICDWAIYTWMPLYLFENFHFSLVKAGFTATAYMKGGGFAGLLLGGVVADAWSRKACRGRVLTQAVGLSIAAPCLILSAVTHTPLFLYVAMVAFGIGKGMYDGNTMPVLCEGISTRLRATAFGFLNFAGTFAGGIIAATAGLLKSSIGLGGTFLGCGAILLGAAALLYIVQIRPAPGEVVQA